MSEQIDFPLTLTGPATLITTANAPITDVDNLAVDDGSDGTYSLIASKAQLTHTYQFSASGFPNWNDYEYVGFKHRVQGVRTSGTQNHALYVRYLNSGTGQDTGALAGSGIAVSSNPAMSESTVVRQVAGNGEPDGPLLFSDGMVMQFAFRQSLNNANSYSIDFVGVVVVATPKPKGNPIRFRRRAGILSPRRLFR